VAKTALNNPKMTEAIVIKGLGNREAPAPMVRLVCSHPQWSVRRDVRLALLRNQHTPLAQAIVFAAAFPKPLVREVLSKSALRPEIKLYLLASLEQHPKPV
jgi:hypothetical protein